MSSIVRSARSARCVAAVTLAVAFAGVASVVTAAPAAAQLTGGLKGGVGQASYTGSQEFGWKISGPNTTLFLNWSDGGRRSQQLDVGESMRLGVSTAGGSTLTFSAKYLDVLLATKFASARRLGTQVFVLVGPRFVYALECNLEFVTALLTSNTACDETKGTNRLDVGAAVGGGLQWTVGVATIGIEARGAASFRSVAVPLASKNSRSLTWAVLIGAAMPIDFSVKPRHVVVAAPPGLPALDRIQTGVITESLPAVAPELAQSGGNAASAKRITVTAADADVRSLLIAIAREAGISLVVSTDVRRRVSVSFKDASPEEAIRAIIAEAGLTVVNPPATRALPAVVYYQLPVNVDEAPAEAIAARFGVSVELAQWLVESRPLLTTTLPATTLPASLPPRPDRQP